MLKSVGRGFGPVVTLLDDYAGYETSFYAQHVSPYWLKYQLRVPVGEFYSMWGKQLLPSCTIWLYWAWTQVPSMLFSCLIVIMTILRA